MKDFILSSVFKQQCIMNESGKKKAISFPADPIWEFCPSNFRYNLPEYANHFILWYSNADHKEDFHEEFINNQIQDWIWKLLNHDSFDFAWYKNPKPSVPEFYHVQVFWIKQSPIKLQNIE